MNPKGPNQSGPDHLYFLGYPEEPDGSRWVKIGRARQVAKRIADLKPGTPKPLEVLGLALGLGAEEGRTHRALAHLRGNGEWFLLAREQWESLRDRLSEQFPEWPAFLAEQREASLEAKREAMRLRAERYPEHVKEIKARAHKDPEKTRAAKNRWREANKDRLREQAREREKRLRADPEWVRKRRQYERDRRKERRMLESRNHAETE